LIFSQNNRKFVIAFKDYMKRDIYKELINWKLGNTRKPLLVRGARQIGKSYIIEEFGKQEFESYVLLNFERNPEYKEIFEGFDPRIIIEKITLYTSKKVVPGKTLVFLDEIQDCPKAILSLRYFYEEMHDLHIVAAGSLLEFALNSPDYRMPVGRIQYLYMNPMSFGEFLDAVGEEVLREYLSEYSNLKKITDHLHQRLLYLLRRYSIIGGMPEVVKEYVLTHDVLKCQQMQHSIIETFVDDFSKYATQAKISHLRKVFYSIPKMIGGKYIYSKVDSLVKSRELKEAVELLEQAGIIHRIKLSDGSGLPLEANVKDNFFKLLFLDIGLVHAISGILSETIKEEDFTSVYKGAIAEQLVGQELIAYENSKKRTVLYYWARDARGSSAELDYLIVQNEKIIPVEVKSGAKGKMKSMFLYMEQFKPTKAYKISQAWFGDNDIIVDLPLYAINHLKSVIMI
jgi:predicted AAA+ superfamily ATPase